MTKDNFWGVLTLVFLIALVIGILTHAYGFSLAAGTLFHGTNSLAGTLEGRGMASGGTKVR